MSKNHTQYYFLVEAINIVNNVFDTDQLSIIRGSSFLLKEAIETVAKKQNRNLEAITTGASTGLFRCKNKTLSNEEIQREISDILQAGNYSLFTFAIEYCEAESLFIAKEKLRTQLRLSQLHSLSIPTDSLKADNPPCELEGKRPQAKPTEIKMVQGKKRKLSYSVAQRLEAGRKMRTEYYEEELKELKELEQLNLGAYTFSQDLESLAKTHRFPKLNQKIAVIYIDGNHFGKIQNKLIRQENPEQKQKDFDRTIQHKRRKFLLHILQGMTDHDNNRFPDAYHREEASDPSDNKTSILRLETLLWGGDEMTIVVPAWLGFELMQMFFEETSDWNIKSEGKEIPLTHAAGLVLCSAKSPIRIMRDLAESIANDIKENSGRDENRWNYIILESIDYPSNNSFEDYWKQRYQAVGLDKTKPLLPPKASDWIDQKQKLQKLILLGDLPRGQLYHIAQAIQNDQKASIQEQNLLWDDFFKPKIKCPTTTEQAQKEQRLLQLGDAKTQRRLKAELPSIAKHLFSLALDDSIQRARFWIHLIETWDYLIPYENPEEGIQ
ncbi:MAG: hypothetical protein KAH22_08910 [Thiotrichaceae bacterium]|nr:hypothetical protein [Thiotrichaceae bacterium]